MELSPCCNAERELHNVEIEHPNERFSRPHPIYICTRCKQIIEEEAE